MTGLHVRMRERREIEGVAEHVGGTEWLVRFRHPSMGVVEQPISEHDFRANWETVIPPQAPKAPSRSRTAAVALAVAVACGLAVAGAIVWAVVAG